MTSNNETLTEAQRELATKNHKLIYAFGVKNKISIDEYYDVLAIGLCNAARTFDKNKGAFSTYAFNCMRNELYKCFNNEHKKASIPQELIMSYDSPISTNNSENEDIFFENILDLKSYDDMMHGIMLSEIDEMLNDKERIIVKLLTDGFTHSEIADKFGCDRSNITHFIKKIRQKLNNYLLYN